MAHRRPPGPVGATYRVTGAILPIRFQIRVGNTDFKPSEQSNSNQRWVTALAGAHLQDQTHCLCGPNPVPLSVKHYGRDTPSSHYGVARWPDTGLDHDPECDFFNEETDSGASAGTKPAFDELGEGRIRAHLAMGLGLAVANGKNKPERAAGGKQGVQATRNRASEVTLLQRLWRHSSLNCLDGNPRNWFGAVLKSLKGADRIVVNRAGSTMADFLLVGTQQSARIAATHNQKVLARAGSEPSRLFVLGRLKQYSAEKTQCLLPLHEGFGLPKILVQTSQLAGLVFQRPFMVNLLSGTAGSVVVLACIEPAGNDWWKVVSIGGITTTTNMVPVDSSYETEFEEYLVSLARKFVKPIAINEIDQDGNRPDFILLDTQPRTRCEVWGMQTEEYLAGKADRIAEYAKRGQRLVSWSANPKEPFPALPAANVQGHSKT